MKLKKTNNTLPFRIPNLYALYEARNYLASKDTDVGTVCTDGSVCGYVKDLSGNSRHLRQGTWCGGVNAQRPTWQYGSGTPYWGFNGSQGFLNNTYTLTGNKTVIVAFKMDVVPSVNTYATLWAISGGSTNTHCAFMNFAGTYNPISLGNDFSGGQVGGADWAHNTNKHVLATICNGGTSNVRTSYHYIVDGVKYAQQLTAGAFAIVTGGAVGANISAGTLSQGLNGRIYAIAVYNRILSDTEINAVSKYFDQLSGNTNTYTAKPVVLCDGDSLTQGVGVTGELSYPYKLSSYLNTPCSVYNIGVAGQNCSQLIADISTQGSKYKSFGVKSIAVIWIGSNDLGGNGGPISGSTLHTLVTNAVTSYKNYGFDKVIVCTVLPRTFVSDPVDYETQRQSFRSLTVPSLGGDSCGADAVVDLAGISTIGDSGDQNNTTYYNADKVHLTSTGYDIVAQEIATTINSFL